MRLSPNPDILFYKISKQTNLTLTGAEGGAPVLESIESISTGCFFRKIPLRKVLSMELVPLNRIKSLRGGIKNSFFLDALASLETTHVSQ